MRSPTATSDNDYDRLCSVSTGDLEYTISRGVTDMKEKIILQLNLGEIKFQPFNFLQ